MNKREYRDYGEYLEDAYEEAIDDTRRKCHAEYICGSRRLDIDLKGGRLEATFTDNSHGSTNPKE